VLQLEILDRPPADRAADNPWPEWARVYRPSYGIAEGGEQRFATSTKLFEGGGQVERLHCVDVAWNRKNGRPRLQELADSERTINADLVLLAMGFLGCETALTSQLGIELDDRGNVRTDAQMMTNVEGVFAAGDMQRGQSLVVWAIADGRRAARAIDAHLRGTSELPVPDGGP
jgi:NADPH-dependent glutamate synthase beta subunit-like oxidoreductase